MRRCGTARCERGGLRRRRGLGSARARLRTSKVPPRTRVERRVARNRHTDRFDDPNLPGETTDTITLTSVACGTDLAIVQEGIPAAIPAEFCYVGWQESLSLLAMLVEPQIPTGS